jgi:hypothetical protein
VRHPGRTVLASHFIYVLLVVGPAESTDAIVYCFGAREPAVKRSVQRFFIVSDFVGAGSLASHAKATAAHFHL